MTGYLGRRVKARLPDEIFYVGKVVTEKEGFIEMVDSAGKLVLINLNTLLSLEVFPYE